MGCIKDGRLLILPLIFLSLFPREAYPRLLFQISRHDKLEEDFKFHPKYWDTVEMAMKYAECVGKQEDQFPSLDKESLIMTQGSCYEDPSCDHCHKEANEGTRVVVFKGFQSPKSAPKPLFHCHSLVPPSSRVSSRHALWTYFRMEYQTPNRLPPTLSQDEIPRMFVVETQINGKWETVSNQSYWSFPKETEPGKTYRIRVTAVSPKYVYEPQESQVITRYAVLSHLGKPKNLREEEMERLVDWEAPRPYPKVTLRWDSGSGLNASCHYDVHYLDEENDHVMRREKPFEAFWVTLPNLQLGKNYTIRLYEKFGLGQESPAAVLTVSLPSCDNLDRCPPPPPIDITIVNETAHTFEIIWKNPNKFKNHTFEYIITVEKIPSIAEGQIYNTLMFKGTLPSNQTHVEVPNPRRHKGHIRVVIVASNKSGKSEEAMKLHFLAGVPSAESVWVKRVWTIVVILLLISLLTVLVVYLKSFRDRMHRNQENMEKFRKWEEEVPAPPDDRYVSKWEIDFGSLILHEVVGKGEFGQVRKATLLKNGGKITVAVKTLRVYPQIMVEEDGEEDGVMAKDVIEKFFRDEFEILKNLESHIHLVRLIGIVTSPCPLFVMEYCDGGDLQTHLRKAGPARPSRRRSPMGSIVQFQTNAEVRVQLSMVTNEAYFMKSEEEYTLTPLDLLSYARQIACGMEFLSSKKIIHRDLAARNVLISGKNRVLKIADFGLSRDVYEQNWYKKRSNGKIPIKWLAIECLMKEVYTTKSDVWSYGILLWEIVTFGATPYPGIDNIKIYDLLKTGYRMKKPENCSNELYDIMLRCWDENPSDRPDFMTIRLRMEDLIESSGDMNYLNLDSSGTVQYSELLDRESCCSMLERT